MKHEHPKAEAAWASLERIRHALEHLKDARSLLGEAGAKKAHSAVSRALKSAHGAERHAERVYYTRYYHERREEGTA